MSEQLALTLAAATVGFLAAVFFCFGAIFNSTSSIIKQSASYYDFSEPLARSLAAQKAQYAVGGLLLLVAFGLQVLAALASSTIPANLPQWLTLWPRFVAAVLLPSGLVAWIVCVLIERSTILKVLQAHREEAARELQESS